MIHTTKIYRNYKDLSIVIFSIVILAGFSLLSYLYWDQELLYWLKQNTYDLDKPLIVKAVTQLGKAWLPIWLLLCWALISKCPQKILIPIMAIFLLVFTVLPLKVITHRHRPRDVIKNNITIDSHSNHFGNWSFPSGDTATVFAVAAAILPFIRWFARGIFFILAGCVGLLRIASFAHYLSDVFAGAAVGIFAAYLAHILIAQRPSLKSDILKLLNPYIILAGVIIIPVMVGILNGLDDLWIFSLFYPPLVTVLFTSSKISMSNWYSIRS